MRSMRRILGYVVIAAALLAPIATSGCAARVRYYDQYHSDWHHWDRDEDRAYRNYLGERHEEYRDFGKLNADQQRDYWNWRHDHPDHH